MGASSRNKGPKRRQKTQPSQGDAVLISFLGGLNVPDVAIRAGEEPLNSASQSEVEDLADSMNEEDESAVVQQNSSLVQAAQDALPLVGGIDKTTENSNDILTSNGSKRRLSKLHTQGLLPPSNAKVSNVSPLIMREGCPNDQVIPKPQATLSSATDAYTRGQSLVTSDSCSPDAKWARSDSPASSPLRKHLISASERSPLEMLPALQSSPPSLSNKSPNSPQTLPPLKAHLGHSYMERDIRNDKNRHGGINPGRQPIPMLNGAVHSPTLASAASSSNQYSRPSSLLNSHLPPPYASTQTSPASPYSETSPREPYRVSQGPRSRSPPSIYDSKQLHPNGCTLQVDKLPPLSANGCSNATKLGSDSSPIVGNSNIETGRPVLSLETAPLTTAPFKCEVPGCTALPFQTQYLLNSHSNVHSQNRPHYCPVKNCSRAEGGKGFKRKNEMIRHGLVHQSPGYICPFCPERKHKYPRPDNLQRHVRGNHTDKDLNDPKLRDVLAQRQEGVSGVRRRRVGG